MHGAQVKVPKSPDGFPTVALPLLYIEKHNSVVGSHAGTWRKPLAS